MIRRKKIVLAQFYSLHLQILERTEQIHEGLKQNSRYSCRNLSLGQTEYEA
jgi:hypothetical protein